MSLDFDLSRIPLETRTNEADRDGNAAAGESFKKGDRILTATMNTLIWATMAVGIGRLSDGTTFGGDKYDTSTIDEFELRITMYEKLFGAMESYHTDDGVKEKPITREVLEAHLGLSTNVSFEKRPAWLKRMADSIERDQAYARRLKAEKAKREELAAA